MSDRLYAQAERYQTQAQVRKKLQDISEQMKLKQKPDINENSKKLLETSKHASSYTNLKVEDRLRLYGI